MYIIEALNFPSYFGFDMAWFNFCDTFTFEIVLPVFFPSSLTDTDETWNAAFNAVEY
jgi:hypothetical protein